ncbi:unnamed protein product [Gordionus sp. m RMFG-2023]
MAGQFFFHVDNNYPIVYFVLCIVFLTLGLLINGGIFLILQKWNAGKRAYYILRFIIILNIIYCIVSISTAVEHAKDLWGPEVPCYHNLTLKRLYIMIIAAILDTNHVLMVAYFYDVYLSITGSDMERTRLTKLYSMIPYIILEIFISPNITAYFAFVNKYAWVQNFDTQVTYVCNYVFYSNAITFNLIFDIFKISVCAGMLVYIFFGMIRFAAMYSSLAVSPCAIDSVTTTIIGQIRTQVEVIKPRNVNYETTRKRYRRNALILFSMVLTYFVLIFPINLYRILYYSRCKFGFCPSFSSPLQRALSFLEMMCFVLLPILFVSGDKNLRNFISIKSR